MKLCNSFCETFAVKHALTRPDLCCETLQFLDKVSVTSDVIYNKGKKDLELEKITNEDLKAFCYLLGDHKVLK